MKHRVSASLVVSIMAITAAVILFLVSLNDRDFLDNEIAAMRIISIILGLVALIVFIIHRVVSAGAGETQEKNEETVKPAKKKREVNIAAFLVLAILAALTSSVLISLGLNDDRFFADERFVLRVMGIVFGVIATSVFIMCCIVSIKMRRDQDSVHDAEELRNAFRGCAVLSLIELTWLHDRELSEEEIKELIIKSLPVINRAFSALTSQNVASYRQIGAFNIYEGIDGSDSVLSGLDVSGIRFSSNPVLTPENRVLMDMFEKLIFGNNSASENRAKQLSDSYIHDLKRRIVSIYTIFSSKKQARTGARAWDDIECVYLSGKSADLNTPCAQAETHVQESPQQNCVQTSLFDTPSNEQTGDKQSKPNEERPNTKENDDKKENGPIIPWKQILFAAFGAFLLVAAGLEIGYWLKSLISWNAVFDVIGIIIAAVYGTAAFFAYKNKK